MQEETVDVNQASLDFGAESNPPTAPAALDPSRFEAAHFATWSVSREHEDGPPGEDPDPGNPPELVATAWRVLDEPYVFPNEEEFREAAQKSGQEVTSTVRSEDGGYRHDLIIEDVAVPVGDANADPGEQR